jgi:hypothetical protein
MRKSEIGWACEHLGGGGATGAMDRGWEVAEAADDGEQELRWSSGEA